MTRRILSGLIVGVLFSLTLKAQTVDSNYDLTRWPNNKQGVVTYTFDDNDANQIPVALPLFDQYDYKVTFFALTNANWRPMDWDALKGAWENGHEVAVHTETHTDLTTLSVDEQRTEYEGSINRIKEHIPEANPITVAYPYCKRGDIDLVNELFIGGRSCSGQIMGATPADYTDISSKVVGSEGAVQNDDDLNAQVDAAYNQNGWVVFLIHGIDDDGGYSPVRSRDLSKHLDYVHENDQKFWVATFEDVIKYIRSRNAMSVTEISADDEEIKVQISDSLDRSIYDQKITVNRVIPEGWDSVQVFQNEVEVPSGTYTHLRREVVWFTVMPDSGEITLKKKVATSNEVESEPESFQLIRNYPNPFNPGTTIAYSVKEAGEVTISIHDVLGKELEVLVQRAHTPGEYSLQWDGSAYSSGTYLYRYESGNVIQTGKMQLVK